ncbi:lipoxygenase homology domain-containing protein 1-like, partial [Gopherus flavomarginatus]|uniref:lipoxygenase homology domain-containing protein 1-like n=1 Tax=Gopherus flavomarginatus TaxID=286002 RepID=UPI0021CC46B9
FQFRDISPLRDKPLWNDPRNKSVAWTKSLRRYRVTLNHRPVESVLSRKAPFAARTLSAGLSGHRYRNGCVDVLPQYSSMNDPHLFDYYARKFGLRGTTRCLPVSDQMKRHHQSAPQYRYKSASTGSSSAVHSNVLYKVTVKTGDKKGSGTDARVFLKMKGSKGKLSKTRLYKKTGSNVSQQTAVFKVSKGSINTFKIHGPEIGEIQNITLEHDGLEKQQAWYVEEITVTNTSREKTWHFLCRQWLSLYHTDCQLSRTFMPTGKGRLAVVDGKPDHT